ncbi:MULTISPECIES: DUF397 domain-containing protein [unclassified Streptomyces]|uniref:DUF397 domain-containing protein n=1 Tax=unclassified Streptomyces TaxID=2593676 RepID=UPI0036EEFE96
MSTVELAWFTSSYSSSGDGDCVEVAVTPHLDTVHIRDSKNRRGPTLRLSPTAWTAFLTHAAR